MACEETVSVTDVSNVGGSVIDYPCLSSSEDCINTMNVSSGTSQMYSSFHIDSTSEVRGVIITIHGHTRNADDYFDKMVSVVSSHGLKDDIMVISPQFGTIYEKSTDTDWYWNTTSWKWGLQSYSAPGGENVSSFSIIDSILNRLSDKNLFNNLSDVLITGHSSGAAFVHMYSASKENNQYRDLNIHFAVVNNQYFLHPDSTRLQSDGTLSVLENCNTYNQWPYGLENLSPYMTLIGQEETKNNFYSNKVDYFIAENDTETTGITSGCQYEVLGSNRYDKNINFMNYLDIHYQNNQHDHSVIPGLGHTTNTYSSETFTNYLNSIF